MRIGVYIDGYNLYYGGRTLCGRGQAGWRWLDLRLLSEHLIKSYSPWSAPWSAHIVYCTARISGADNPSGAQDQDVYLRALRQHRSVDVVEYGIYKNRIASSPLATKGPKGRPQIVRPDWPIMVKSDSHGAILDGKFLASVARREEKGSDVNVATHLLVDVLDGKVDAAVVISNDTDLALPVKLMRLRIPVGLVNPAGGYPAGALNGSPNDGVGGHWWHQMAPGDLTTCQLPASAGKLTRPVGW